MTSDPAARAGAILEIDLAGIVANWRLLAHEAAPARCAAVVKANGYGLGAAPVARALAAAGCRLFFVATLDEGIGLRQDLGPLPEIAVLNGPLPGTVAEFAAHKLVPVLNDPGQIEEWRELDARPPGILHVDTGMARLGLSAREFAAVVDDPPPWRAVMSHLACADHADHPLNRRQHARFAAVSARLPGVTASLAASSGIFLGPAYHFDLVRPGAALFGVNPQPGRPNPLRQIVRLSAKIVQVRQIDRGESVGYGAAHVMAAAGRAAVVAVGYADGWLRALSHRGCGYLAGTRVPLLGRVSMDLVTFDVSAVSPALARPGAMIELLGADYGVDAAAADAGTIGYEILTALGARYHRIYRDPAELAVTGDDSAGMIVFLASVGAAFLAFLAAAGRLVIFAVEALAAGLTPPYYPRLILRQVVYIGYFSLPVVGLTAVFTGMVLALQSHTGFSRFNAEGAIATVVVLSVTRELGPVIAGLMVAGRVGAAMAAEIGTMRVTDQIDAMTTLSTDPLRYLVLPRLLAGLVTLPALVLVADIIGVFGGFLVGTYKFDFNPAAYLTQTEQYLATMDVVSGLVKAAVFGFIVALMGCYQGYHSHGGAEGVGQATTHAVVSASILILLSDYFLTQAFFA